MPTVSNGMDKYLSVLRTKVVNSGGKFITPADELNALNEAAITVAAKLGGLKFVDSSQVTVAGSSSIQMPNTVETVLYLELIDTTVTPNTVTFVDVVDYQFFRALNYPSDTSNQFAWFDPNTKVLTIAPAPTKSAVTVRVVCHGLPNEILGTSVALYDGDVVQMAAITTEAAAILRGRTRDLGEMSMLHARANESVEDAANIMSRQNQVTRVGVGRARNLNRLRKI